MRHLDDVQSVIESMFGVVDIFESAIAWKAGVLTVQNPELAAPVMTGRMFGSREYGGRIASQIMAPIVVRQPLPLKNLIDSNRTRGRILQLWNLTGERQIVSHNDVRLLTDLRDIEEQFFGDGLACSTGWSRKAAFRATIR